MPRKVRPCFVSTSRSIPKKCRSKGARIDSPDDDDLVLFLLEEAVKVFAGFRVESVAAAGADADDAIVCVEEATRFNDRRTTIIPNYFPKQAMSNQKSKTIDYWDDFYSSVPSADLNEPASELEWIVPNSFVLDTILSIFPTQSQAPRNARTKNYDVRLLEVGCGVSRLSISLLQRLLLYCQGINTNSHDIYFRYNFVATDVSSVCIEHNRERDSAYASSICNGRHRFSYEVLNVLSYDASSPHNQQYDMILDKGTLDTFLFRSKRTNKGSTAHPTLLTQLLNNVHRWLRCGCDAKYVIISPRAKIKSIRDFNGFARVRRIKLDTTASSNDVVLVKGNGENSKLPKSEVYLYECIKNDSYHPTRDAPYRDVIICNTRDESLCSTCGISFKEFLGKVDSRDQGEVAWERRWKNHCVHCKI